jgi:phosphoribosylformylglycinamidine synthase PurS subunit
MYKANITVALRPAILDVQGKAVESALHNLGYGGIEHVRMGKAITMSVDVDTEIEAKRIVEEACAKLLTNPIIEDFQYRLERVTNGKA